MAMTSRGISRHLSLLPLDRHVQSSFPHLCSQEYAETLAFQFHTQALQIGQVRQCVGDIVERLGFSLGSRIAPTGIRLNGRQFVQEDKKAFLGDE